LYKISCKEAKVVFFENEENQQIFIENKIVKEENTCKLNGAGVNLEEFKFCEYPEDNDEIRFLFIGRIMKEKGVDEIFEVAQWIRKEYKNVFFDIVGPLEENYIDIIHDLQKQNIINYYGYQSDVKSFIKKAHCFILPSYHEGMANTLLESGAMGRPLITSNIPGCKEAVIDGETGYLVNVEDSEDLYNKMLEFILLSSKQKKIMGYKSSEYIKGKFDKKNVVNKTIKRLRGE
jgi:galacturonosyltransferase